ncbi:MAG: hypothetical protein V1806_15800 [Pseudomonadota bacterium]
MLSFLDIRTLSFASAVIAAILFSYMAHLQLTRKTYPGFRQWTLAALTAGAGLILVVLRGLTPDLITIVSANFLITVAMMLIYRGLATFGGLRTKIWTDAGVMIVFLGLLSWFTYSQPSVTWRIIFFSVINTYYALRAAWLAATTVARLLGSRNGQLIGTLAGYGAFFMLRAVLTFLWEEHLSDFMTASTLQALTFLVSFVGHILTFTGLIFLNIQRLELDFTIAQQELKVLGGLLPICAHCKRIRDDGGGWHQMESYIKAHSQADFTHGICPQCLRELYPDLAEGVLAGAASSPGPPARRPNVQ